MFKKVLIANRGEIACRIARTLKKMGIQSVAIYSDADKNSLHVSAADEKVALGGQTAAESYLQIDKVIAAAKATGAEAIIPGYGFLSENAAFAARCEQEGLVFVGPTSLQMEQFGLKHAAREIAEKANVPLTPGSGLLPDVATAKKEAARVGYPVMLKSTAGGGGIGLTRCNDEEELVNAFESVQRMGKSFFANSDVFVERFVPDARHIEVQIFGDGVGNVIALGERDCSLQRRNQKVVEETPAPHISDEVRQRLYTAAESLGRSVAYRSAGTVEFIYDSTREEFYFLEVNTRLQVEHGITEAVTGVDLVEWMILTAAGKPPALNKVYPAKGAAIEVRVYAENPLRNFTPSPGVLTEVVFPDDVRVDTWVNTGTEVSPLYDPMIAKIIVYGDNRNEAINAMLRALDQTSLYGITTNLDYLKAIVGSQGFKDVQISTGYLNTFEFHPRVMEILDAGTYTTIQDYPGRMGYWHIGVPPSGPMDHWAFRAANRIVGNHAHAAAIETTVLGPTIKFHVDTVIALTGAPTEATLDDVSVAFWTPVSVKKGQVLKTGRATSGTRTYIAIRDGIDVPLYLGSRSTFALGQFGGHAGRTLRASDVLPIQKSTHPEAAQYAPAAAPDNARHTYGNTWEVAVLYGPHGAPDFFTPEAIDMFFASEWAVHYNSNRLGIRLVGPKPTWARSDGGEAGLHPSNVHDCEYAIGSINFTGDMPVILTQDGPSLGGFVCAATIVKGDLWKVGQFKPGDKIRFKPVTFDEALALEKAQNHLLDVWNESVSLPELTKVTRTNPILFERAEGLTNPKTVFRQAGDKYILIEYGENILDLNLRFRVHALMLALDKNPIAGVEELSPGVRSVQVRYDSLTITQSELVAALAKLDSTLTGVETMKVTSRVVHLPMAYEDSSTLEAVARYRQSVRNEAPWLPSNTEFIRRINGLDNASEVEDIVFKTSYMVLGLGDVYLGAPCAVPVDPRHRLLTSKYNPARTYTAEGAVGIGGVYMCIYGMDSPGGYQLVGRTLPIWNKFLKNAVFINNEPWLLKFFDQVRFYPVSEAELDQLRIDFREGRQSVKIEEEIFDLGEYNAFIKRIAPDLAAFKEKQKQAFTEEVARWSTDESTVNVAEQETETVIDEHIEGDIVRSEMTGNTWKVLVEENAHVKKGDPLLIIEAMKMEFQVLAPEDGIVSKIFCRPGKLVNVGDPLLVMED